MVDRYRASRTSRPSPAVSAVHPLDAVYSALLRAFLDSRITGPRAAGGRAPMPRKRAATPQGPRKPAMTSLPPLGLPAGAESGLLRQGRPLEPMRDRILALRRELDEAYTQLADRDAQLEALEVAFEAAVLEWAEDVEPWEDHEPEFCEPNFDRELEA